MNPTSLALFAIVAAILVWVAWGITAAFRASWRLRGVRLVTCPETERTAAVEFDRVHAAFTAVVEDAAETRLAQCSRWPERGPCDQPCIPDAQAPNALLSALVARWSGQQRCALCAKPLGEDPLVSHHVALHAGDRGTTEWPELAPQTIPDVLRTAEPICWNCHIAETFRRQHPELVVDR